MNDPGVMTARLYQVQLEELASSRNTIIYLPTGSGKTFIAIHLIKRFKEALQEPWGYGGKRTFFLVNNVPLVTQQKKVIEKLCPVDSVGAFSGLDGVDHWDKNKWDQELTKHQVIVMTCQILSDMLTHQYIQMEDINLMIFDECHHAVEDHPMRLVMKQFQLCDPAKQPRVLGLTATLLNSNATNLLKVQEILKCLETTFHATIATVNEMGEVLQFSTNPHESLQYHRPLPLTKAAIEATELLNKTMTMVMEVRLPTVKGDPGLTLKRNEIDISTDPLKIIKGLKNLIVAMIGFIAELGVYGGSLSIVAFLIILERQKKIALTKEEAILYEYVVTNALLARDILEKSMEKDKGFDKIEKHSSEKVMLLLAILKEYNPDVIKNPNAKLHVNTSRKPISAIIFTQQRITSKILYNLLQEVIKCKPDDYGFLKHDFIVGFNLNPLKCTREQHYTKKQSQKALLKFGNKDLNLLISTSVIEEGVDVPQCSLVVRFDQPMEYRSYMQSKGRARSSESSFVMLIKEENRTNFQKKYQTFQVIEEYIQEMLIANADSRAAPSAKDIQDKLYDDDEIEPYINEYGGSRLSAVQAISLLNRYCSVLPRDQFTTITPTWILKHLDNAKKVVSIILPIASPIKEPIEGHPYIDLKTAKRSAALNACVKLHQCGELDPLTLLPNVPGEVDFDLVTVKKCFPNWVEDSQDGIPKSGTKKRMRKHKRVFPSCLNGLNDWTSGQNTFYLHVIKLKAAFEKPTDSRELALYNILQDTDGYGFLTTQPLPSLCDFPMFLVIGEVTTTLVTNYSKLRLNRNTFEMVKTFHYFLFDQVLAVAKKFLSFDGTVNCLFAVPVKWANGGYEIDRDVMSAHSEVAPVVVPSYEERQAIIANDSYKNCVVSPWYRNTIIPDRYLVTEVLEYMTPKSQFATDVYCSYEEYYDNKYNLQIVGREDQPLLEVKNITTRMNCLLPRAATIQLLTEKQLKLLASAEGDNKPTFKEIFIPEFCIKYEYPGPLWYKATMLPSIIHRIHMLLVADELRSLVAKEANIGVQKLPPEMVWKPIDLDLHVAKNSLLSEVEWSTPLLYIDRINNPIDENAPRPKVQSMKDAIYTLQKKKISKEYPWDESSEPLDIERNILSVTLMDIECYNEFVGRPAEGCSTEGNVFSPARTVTKAPAILPAPWSHKGEIRILQPHSNFGPELKDVLTALTTINSHDMFNLERAETLGDSFLKFAATLYLFHKFPTMSEGQLTNIKGRLIGNRNLFYAGQRIKLGGRMKVEQFSPRCDFMLPGFFAPKKVRDLIEQSQIRPTFLIGMQLNKTEILSGQLSSESWEQVVARLTDEMACVEKEPEAEVQNAMQCYIGAQAVSDKSVADCVEALIGTYLLSGGIFAAVRFLEWLRVIPKEDNFSTYFDKHLPTPITLGKATNEDIDFLLDGNRKDIEKRIGYTFKDPSYLLEAMSHPSFIRNRLTRSYERLEFLGDAILDFLITSYVYENSRDLKPGQLTDLRSALVNNVTFASYVVKLGLHKYLCCQLNPMLDSAIISFVEHQEQRNHEIIEDVLYLIDEEDCQVAEYVEVPKALSDIFESLAGAIYLDCGGDLHVVWRVFYRIMWKEIAAFSSNVPIQPVRMLYESIHACPIIGKSRLTNSPIPRVMVPVTVTKEGQQITVHGFGNNKFQAKRAAAKLALRVLNL